MLYRVAILSLMLGVNTAFASPLSQPKPAEEAQKAVLNVKDSQTIDRERTETLARVSAYLNGIKTLKAGFTQTDAAGGKERGTFTMRRPSQARWEYKAPSPLLLIANAGFLAIVDRELQEIRNVPADHSLSNILSAKNVDLANMPDIVTDVPITSGEHIYVMLQKKNAGYDGTLTLHFTDNDNTLELAGFVQLDAAGRTTEILFHDVELNTPVDRKAFDVPEFKRRGRR